MNRIWLPLLLVIASACGRDTGSPQNFHELAKRLGNDPEINNRLVEEFILQKGGCPVIEGDSVIFLINVNGDDQPELLASYNAFMSQRYVEDQSLSVMHRLSNSAWYVRTETFASDARIFYLYKAGGRTMMDPRNATKAISFGDSVSVMRMPGFKESEFLKPQNAIVSGTVTELKLVSKFMTHIRTVHVYTPPGYERSTVKYPVLYFHDGSNQLEEGKAAILLDNLITSGRIEPHIAVFDNPVERGKEYRGDAGYIRYFSEELVSFVDANYRSKGDRKFRTVIGFSRGGMSALYLGHLSNTMANVVTFSPAIFPESMENFTKKLESSPYSPDKIFILGATYDYVWYKDAKALRKYFTGKPVELRYLEISEGHHIVSWNSRFEQALRAVVGD